MIQFIPDAPAAVPAPVAIDTGARAAREAAETARDTARDWATKTDGTVDGTDYSAKYWATHANVATVAGGIGAIGTVAASIGAVTTVAAATANLGTVAASIGAVTTVASNIAGVQAVVANLAAVQSAAANAVAAGNSATAAALSAASVPMFSVLPPESGYAGLAVLGANKRIFLTFLPDGTIVTKFPGNFLPTGVTVTSGVLPESGYAIPFVDPAGRLFGGFTPDGRFRARLDALTEYDVLPGANSTPGAIVCWGDSLTQGAGGTPFTTTLASLSGRTVHNRGLGGQTSIQIAARQGGGAFTVTGAGFTISAGTGAVALTVSSDIGYSGGTHPAASWAATIGGVAGTLAMDTSGNYTFARSIAGSATVVAAGTAISLADSIDRKGNTQVLWPGRNPAISAPNFTDAATDQLIADLQAMIAFASGPVAILSTLNGAGEGIGTTNYPLIKRQNDKLRLIFGDLFVDVRQYLVTYGLADAGLTATGQDTTDVAADTVPASLRSDAIHLNSAGYAVVGRLVWQIVNRRKI